MLDAKQGIPAEPQALAEMTARVMYARDAAAQEMGMEIVAVRPGYARMTMRVRASMLNGHQTCHGGFIFALADTAFAYACNSRNHNTVASGCSIDYLSPGREGDLLQAEAVEKSLSGKTGVYDIAVTNQDGKLIALFRGKSHRIQGEVIGEAGN
ncbi:hydroxyphenylacetyl-CoA thioesterase PaaI [Noviherbaspirillum cavernae]|uniref:Hydroxyphenylacetyl-CoA thioesterase PaaI n=1 Tax=Noviherbaspirillum cavernae TaxID=2320862 RepID=A0A418X543_9BURK|nr:hydroxyphenylacetyl-CoA thioesterase PaaI [Noviherbaspirillum cavernae]RJG07539.1 hydroxyphenylacetyl-CoA thioesterase PaaI [Noviherbaspirillum cavernae]